MSEQTREQTRERTAVRTLLGEWIEQERMARGHTMVEAARACGIHEASLMAARGKRAYLSSRTRAGLGAYLRVTPEMVSILRQIRCEPSRTFRYREHRTRILSALGQALESERKRRGETMEEAATTIGIHATTLWMLKAKSSRRMNWATVRRVAGYLGIEADLVQVWSDSPAGSRLPLETWVGRKLHPTVRPQTESGADATCERCVFLPGCHEDVARGDFAWCEDATERDLDTGESGRVYEPEWEVCNA